MILPPRLAVLFAGWALASLGALPCLSAQNGSNDHVFSNGYEGFLDGVGLIP